MASKDEPMMTEQELAEIRKRSESYAAGYAEVFDPEGLLVERAEDRRKLLVEVDRLKAELEEARMMYEGACKVDARHLQEAAEEIRKLKAERDALVRERDEARALVRGLYFKTPVGFLSSPETDRAYDALQKWPKEPR